MSSGMQQHGVAKLPGTSGATNFRSRWRVVAKLLPGIS